ncbi:MAG: ATPase [Nitrospinae bacterium CG11_big_fil_rev_8_21_14_0_20_56_8]|nr:MAG: ATPase [Nitrospinae bacterium CG11_big_fil_rev_8_21_14_0_20_56_8]
MERLKKELTLCVRARYPLLYLLTFEENRAEGVINEIGKTLSKEVVSWTFSRGFDPAQEPQRDSTKPEEALKLIIQSPKKAIFVLKDFHPFLERELVVRLMRDLSHHLKRSYKTVILVSPSLKIPPELEKDLSVFDLPLPDSGELAEVLTQLIAPYRNSNKVNVDLSPEVTEKVVQATLGLTRNEAENVYAKALIRERNFGVHDIPEIILEKQQLIRKSGILNFINLSTQMKDVGGLGELKKWLRQRSRAFSAQARDYGLPEPKGLLLLGVQGCGKSLAAKAIAAEWNLPLLRLDVGKIFNSFVGDSEQNMRRAIFQAEAMSPTVLWLDEIEKGFSGTTSSGSVDAGVTARVFATFLTWMQEKVKPVFVIATSNNIAELPPELFRKGRFDEIFFIDLPDLQEREQIFRIHIQAKKRDPGQYDLVRFAMVSESFSGAEIEQAVVSAMYSAFPEDREFTSEDILNAVEETVPLAVTAKESVDRLRLWAKNRARPASHSLVT